MLHEVGVFLYGLNNYQLVKEDFLQDKVIFEV
jgi:hypothetical protein